MRLLKQQKPYLNTMNIINHNWKKIIIILLIVYLSNTGLKYIINQDRPVDACSESPGFPSGHAAVSFALIPLFNMHPFSILLALVISTERVFSHEHTLIQVIAGALFGFVVSYIFNKITISK